MLKYVTENCIACNGYILKFSKREFIEYVKMIKQLIGIKSMKYCWTDTGDFLEIQK